MGYFSTIILILLVTSAPAFGFGLGLVVGQPTGLSFKSDAQGANAFDGALSWKIGDDSSAFDLTGDYLWHHGPHVYYGLGARIKTSAEDDDAGGGGGKKGKGKKAFVRYPDGSMLESDIDIAPRVPLGIRHYFGNPAVEVFAEVAALVGIIPEFDLDVGLAIGARYFF